MTTSATSPTQALKFVLVRQSLIITASTGDQEGAYILRASRRSAWAISSFEAAIVSLAPATSSFIWHCISNNHDASFKRKVPVASIYFKRTMKIEVVGHSRTPFLLQAGAQFVSQPPTPRILLACSHVGDDGEHTLFWGGRERFRRVMPFKSIYSTLCTGTTAMMDKRTAIASAAPYRAEGVIAVATLT